MTKSSDKENMKELALEGKFQEVADRYGTKVLDKLYKWFGKKIVEKQKAGEKLNDFSTFALKNNVYNNDAWDWGSLVEAYRLHQNSSSSLTTCTRALNVKGGKTTDFLPNSQLTEISVQVSVPGVRATSASIDIAEAVTMDINEDNNETITSGGDNIEVTNEAVQSDPQVAETNVIISDPITSSNTAKVEEELALEPAGNLNMSSPIDDGMDVNGKESAVTVPCPTPITTTSTTTKTPTPSKANKSSAKSKAKSKSVASPNRKSKASSSKFNAESTRKKSTKTSSTSKSKKSSKTITASSAHVIEHTVHGREVKRVDYNDDHYFRSKSWKKVDKEGRGTAISKVTKESLQYKLVHAVPDDGIAGIKQDELTDEHDLKATKFNNKRKGIVDMPVVSDTEEEVAIIIRPYLEFVANLPNGTLTNSEKKQINAFIQTFGSIEVVHARVVSISGILANTGLAVGGGARLLEVTIEDSSERTINMDNIEDSYMICYTPPKSDLLSTDPCILNYDFYKDSLELPSWMTVNAPVRKLFSDGKGSFEYNEGTIYYIAPDMLQNPFESIRVVWLDQEYGSNQWYYSYEQMYNDCSPWELVLSEYVEEANIAFIEAPKVSSNLQKLPITALDIVNYLKECDFAYVYLLRVQEITEFVDKFPLQSDQLDLHIITEKATAGDYDIGDKLAVNLLFEDLDRMVLNSKEFNACNRDYQVWRMCDMFECHVFWLKQQLYELHSFESLETEVVSGINSALKARVPVRQAL